ncbi:MAG: leucine-rich repeat domain-containing protein [Desulfobacterales bacterium]|nr:leucine-rich repeat domain-containing protein [Desulfobacterales bacterium]
MEFSKKNASHCKIEELSISNVHNLEILKLGNNQISDISRIRELPKLKILHLGNNQIQNGAFRHNCFSAAHRRIPPPPQGLRRGCFIPYIRGECAI